MIQLIGDAFVWRSGMAIDADGSPHAYAPAGMRALDYLANAGKPGNWWGIVCNDMGLPFVQGADDPAPGHYVSCTALVDRSKPRHDPRRYVDSETVPYVTTTRDMRQRGCRLGDVAMVFYGAAACAAIVADVGPHPGEGSIALARDLGIPHDPKHGGVDASVVSYVLFTGTALGWPRSNDDVRAQAEKSFGRWGSYERLAVVLGG